MKASEDKVSSRRRILEAELRKQRRKTARLRRDHVTSRRRTDVTRQRGSSKFILDRMLTSQNRRPKRSTDVTSRNSDEEPRSRKKRYISYPRNVEVMVTADNAMLKAHDDVEHYVLTLMAIVSALLHSFFTLSE